MNVWVKTSRHRFSQSNFLFKSYVHGSSSTTRIHEIVLHIVDEDQVDVMCAERYRCVSYRKRFYDDYVYV